MLVSQHSTPGTENLSCLCCMSVIPCLVMSLLTFKIAFPLYISSLGLRGNGLLALVNFPFCSTLFSLAHSLGRRLVFKLHAGHPGHISALSAPSICCESFIKRALICAMPSVSSLAASCALTLALDTTVQLTTDIRDYFCLRVFLTADQATDRVFKDRQRRRKRADFLVYHALFEMSAILLFGSFLFALRYVNYGCSIPQCCQFFLISVEKQMLFKVWYYCQVLRRGVSWTLSLSLPFPRRVPADSCREVWQRHRRRFIVTSMSFQLCFTLCTGTYYFVVFYRSMLDRLPQSAQRGVAWHH